jgi:hypothetical protein
MLQLLNLLQALAGVDIPPSLKLDTQSPGVTGAKDTYHAERGSMRAPHSGAK